MPNSRCATHGLHAGRSFSALSLFVLAVSLAAPCAHARTLQASGTLKAPSIVVLGANISGAVVEVSCQVNDAVKKGQTCARLESRAQQRAVDTAKADLAVMMAHLEKSNAKLAHAQSAYRRTVPLAERGIVAKVSLENLHSTYNDAQAQYDYDKAQIELRRAQLAQAELQLSHATVTASIDGVVLESLVATGAPASPTMFVIASSLETLQAVIRVDELNIGKIKLADKAKVAVRAFPGQSFAGTVARVDSMPQVTGGGVSYDVVVAVDNTNLRLKPGMSVEVNLHVAD